MVPNSDAAGLLRRADRQRDGLDDPTHNSTRIRVRAERNYTGSCEQGVDYWSSGSRWKRDKRQAQAGLV